MKHIKVLFIMLLVGAVPILEAEEAHAGIFGDFFSFIGSFFSGGDDTSASTKNQEENQANDEVTLNFGDTTYEEASLTERLNERDDMKNYSKQFGFSCLHIDTDTNQSFTMKFNTSSGKILDMTKEKSCDTTITVQESLIIEFQENGFNQSKVGSYMDQADAPTSVYLKAMDIFSLN